MQSKNAFKNFVRIMSIPEVGKKIRVTVPSTTANLGPGFDCLGAALDLYN